MPRWRLAAMTVALAMMLVPGLVMTPGSSVAQDAGSQPYIHVVPDCLPLAAARTQGSHELDVRGGGFVPGSEVEVGIVLDGQSIAGSVTAAVNDVGAFRARPMVTTGSAANVTVDVRTVGDGPRARAQVGVPCRPQITITPDCGPGGGAPASIDVSGRGFLPDRDVTIVVRGGEIQRELDSSAVGGDGTFRREVTLGDLPDGTYDIIAVQILTSTAALLAQNNIVAVAPLEVPCAAAVITLEPDCEPPGGPPARWSIVVEGTGFHPGTEVMLMFDRPGSFEAWLTRTDRGGAFRVVIGPYQRPAKEAGFVVRAENAPAELATRIATARLRVPCAPTPTPTPTLPPLAPSITASSCGERPDLAGRPTGRYRVVVNGEGFLPGVDVVVTFDPTGSAETTTASTDGAGRFRNAELRPTRRPIGTYRIVVVQAGPVVASRVPAGEITAQTSYAVPCEPLEPPQPVLDPACGPIASRDEVAYQIGVTGSGFYRDATVFVATGGGDNADTVTAAADTEGSFSAILPARGQSDVGYRIHAYQVDSAGAIAAVARTPFTVPCPYDPSITLTPDAGPPGYTTRVTGTDFPPGEPVSLRWDRGLGAATAIDVSAGPDGAFEVYVFILPRDFQGPRMLAADTPQAPGAYPDVTAAFVVTAGQGMPGDRDRDDYIVRR